MELCGEIPKSDLVILRENVTNISWSILLKKKLYFTEDTRIKDIETSQTNEGLSGAKIEALGQVDELKDLIRKLVCCCSASFLRICF
jgi:hypothetical protein